MLGTLTGFKVYSFFRDIGVSGNLVAGVDCLQGPSMPLARTTSKRCRLPIGVPFGGPFIRVKHYIGGPKKGPQFGELPKFLSRILPGLGVCPGPSYPKTPISLS